MFRFRELQQPFPSVAESVRPFARHRVALMPDVFLRMPPTLLPQRENQIENVSASLAIDHVFLDIYDHGPVRSQNPEQFRADREEPLDVLVGQDAAVGVFAAIRKRRRSHNQTNRFRRKRF